jgi:hypothetical protein
MEIKIKWYQIGDSSWRVVAYAYNGVEVHSEVVHDFDEIAYFESEEFERELKTK